MKSAFDRNQIQTTTGFSKFPLSYNFMDFNDYFSLNINAISLTDTMDIIEKYASENIMIFDVEHYGEISLCEIADENKIQYSKYDNENIIISKSDLNNFINFSHYNLKLLDTDTKLNENEYIELLEKIQNVQIYGLIFMMIAIITLKANRKYS